MAGIKVLGTGSYAPQRIATNQDYTAVVETSDEWISTRTGMHERHISQGEPTWYMGAKAAQEAVDRAGISAGDVGLIIAATITGDFYTPSLACLVQRELGVSGGMAIDVNCACAGFVYAFDMARRYLETDPSLTYAVVVSSENLTKLTDYSDRSTCVLFGDGAAACVLTRSEGLYTSFLGADGTGAKSLFSRSIPPANAFMPDAPQTYPDGFPACKGHYIYQDGREVYKFAIKALPLAVNGAAEKIGFDIHSLDLIIPHQANIRIIETAVDRLGVSPEKFYINLERYGNTSSASIPLALDEVVKAGKIKRGDKVCLVGFGAGLTYGAVIFEY
ncbi:MAG: beta-ketoacyl-ACP synthase III [Oscillospiraceae bacterium]